MISYRLKFTDETEAKTTLPSFHAIHDGVDTWITANHRWALNPIGPMYTSNAIIDPVTKEITTPAVIDNFFHINIRLMDITLTDEVVLSGKVVNPANPRYLWAGE